MGKEGWSNLPVAMAPHFVGQTISNESSIMMVASPLGTSKALFALQSSVADLKSSLPMTRVAWGDGEYGKVEIKCGTEGTTAEGFYREMHLSREVAFPFSKRGLFWNKRGFLTGMMGMKILAFDVRLGLVAAVSLLDAAPFC